MKKVIMVLLTLLGTSVTQAEAYRKNKLSSVWYENSSHCEKEGRELVELMKYFSNDGRYLVASSSCESNFSRRDGYTSRLDSSIKTKLKRGLHSLGSFCMTDIYVEPNRRLMALLSNEEAQIFLVDNSAEQGCADIYRKHITVKINLE